jgi:hypothetical protein
VILESYGAQDASRVHRGEVNEWNIQEFRHHLFGR